jgi:hypothetical protein
VPALDVLLLTADLHLTEVSVSSKSNGTSQENTDELGAEERVRREFLKKAGRFAVVTPPSISLLLGTSLSSRAIAGSNGSRPGWGWGDKNHFHRGPPGQS